MDTASAFQFQVLKLVDEHELSEESEAKTNGTIKVDEPSEKPEVQKRSLFFWPTRFLKGFAR